MQFRLKTKNQALKKQDGANWGRKEKRVWVHYSLMYVMVVNFWSVGPKFTIYLLIHVTDYNQIENKLKNPSKWDQTKYEINWIIIRWKLIKCKVINVHLDKTW